MSTLYAKESYSTENTIARANPYFNQKFWYDYVQDNCTLLVKTFRRPLTLANTLKGVRKFYPTIQIFVADDGHEEYTDERAKLLNVQETVSHEINYNEFEVTKYWVLPFDSGLSYGRNFMVEQAETPFVFVMDDDTVFTESTQLERLVWTLVCYNYDIVGCHIPRNFFQGILNVTNRQDLSLHVTFMTPRTTVNTLPLYDFVVNIFMARRSKLKHHKWNEKLKLCEHKDFFYRNAVESSKHHMRITFSPDSIVLNTEADEMDYRVKYRKNKERIDGFQKLQHQELAKTIIKYHPSKVKDIEKFNIVETIYKPGMTNPVRLWANEDNMCDKSYHGEYSNSKSYGTWDLWKECYDEIYVKSKSGMDRSVQKSTQSSVCTHSLVLNGYIVPEL